MAFKKVHNDYYINDIVMLNIELMQWEVVSTYGYHPHGRWNSAMIEIENKIIVFGGKNLE